MSKLKKLTHSLRTRSVRVGGYSVIAICIVVALVILVNVIVGALPTTMTQADLTSNRLFTISDQTKKLLSSLKEDVTLYWVVQTGQEDTVLENLLTHYDTGSAHIRLEKIDPDVNPTFVKKYIGEELDNNTLVVSGAKRFRYVDIDEIYLEQRDYETFELVYSFAGEDAITSAVDYVTREKLPKIALVTGHGELALNDSYQRAMSLDNFETVEIPLAQKEIPQDTDLLLIAAPTGDITAAEAEKIKQYLAKGGDMLLVSGYTEEETPNLYSCVESYGVHVVPGMAVEADSNYTVSGNPYYLIPNMLEHSITKPLTDKNYTVFLPYAQGLQVEAAPQGVKLTGLLTTSDQAYAKIDDSQEKQEGDVEGPFSLAVAITHAVSEKESSNVVWISCPNVLSSDYYGENLDFYMNCLNWISGNERSISIRAKVESTPMLEIKSDSANTMKVLMIAIIPLCYLAIGISVYSRRKKQ